MRKRALLSVGLLALAGAAFLAATNSARAQGPNNKRLIRQGYYNNYFNSFSYRPSYYNPPARQPRYFFYPLRGVGYPWLNYRSSHGWHFHHYTTEPQRAEQPEPPKDTHAHILVRVPAGAELWFNDTKVTGEGEVRKFASPALTAGQRYSYEVRAEWKQDGQTIARTHQLTVRAGAHIDVDFTKNDGVEK